MGSAALVITNQALAGSVTASSVELEMPAANLLTPHPSEKWRAQSNDDYFLLNKGELSVADTFHVKGLTRGNWIPLSPSATVRLRLSSADKSGAAGDVYDSGSVPAGDTRFDPDYFSATFCSGWSLPWRYARFTIKDPLASFVEAGSVLAGLREAFAYNFKPGSLIQYTDRSAVQSAAGGAALTLEDNWFRAVDLSFDLNEVQRWGLIERLNRIAGRRNNVLLILDPESANLARDSIFGLVADLTPDVYAQAIEIYGKQLRISERI